MSMEWAKGLPWWAPYEEAGVAYDLSKRLPEIIRNLRTRKCYFALRNNFFVVEFLERLPRDRE